MICQRDMRTSSDAAALAGLVDGISVDGINISELYFLNSLKAVPPFMYM